MQSFMKIGTALFACTLSACSVVWVDSASMLCLTEKGTSYPCVAPQTDGTEQTNLTASTYRSPAAFKAKQHYVVLNDYIEQMALTLYHQLDSDDMQGAISVGSFFNETLPARSEEMSERIGLLFANALQQLNLPTQGHHAETGGIRLGATSGYVLTGVLTQDAERIRMDVSLVNTSDKRIVASANQYIPAFVYQAL